MNNEAYLWLVLGLVPYYVTHKYADRNQRQVEIRALFWSLELRQRPRRRYEWKLRIPLITRLRDLIWAVVLQLLQLKAEPPVKAEPPEETETSDETRPESDQDD